VLVLAAVLGKIAGAAGPALLNTGQPAALRRTASRSATVTERCRPPVQPNAMEKCAFPSAL